MESPVNLTNLRGMTGGDLELEKELFKEFFSSFEKGIVSLKDVTDSNNEEWRATSHSLKGISLNLGAERLGLLCKKAQEESGAPASEKQKILQNIEDEYEQVRSYLMGIIQS